MVLGQGGGEGVTMGRAEGRWGKLHDHKGPADLGSLDFIPSWEGPESVYG